MDGLSVHLARPLWGSLETLGSQMCSNWFVFPASPCPTGLFPLFPLTLSWLRRDRIMLRTSAAGAAVRNIITLRFPQEPPPRFSHRHFGPALYFKAPRCIRCRISPTQSSTGSSGGNSDGRSFRRTVIRPGQITPLAGFYLSARNLHRTVTASEPFGKHEALMALTAASLTSLRDALSFCS